MTRNRINLSQLSSSPVSGEPNQITTTDTAEIEKVTNESAAEQETQAAEATSKEPEIESSHESKRVDETISVHEASPAAQAEKAVTPAVPAAPRPAALPHSAAMTLEQWRAMARVRPELSAATSGLNASCPGAIAKVCSCSLLTPSPYDNEALRLQRLGSVPFLRAEY